MDHIRILRRAFEITRLYRALWVFGILVALTTARGGNGGGGGGGGGSNRGNFPVPPNFGPFQMPSFSPQVINTFIAVGIGLICVFILLAVIFAIIHYVSQAALVRMVNGYETSGEKVSVGTGFRLGWSRATFRTWVVDFILGLAGLLVFIVLMLIAAAPLLLWLTHNQAVSVIGTIVWIGLVFLFILLLVIAAALLSMVVQIIRRVILIEGLGVMDGIRRGWEMVRRRLGDVIIMGLIMFGLGLAWAIVMIPVVIMLVILGGLFGGIPGLVAGGITNIFVHQALPVIIGLLVGLPIFLTILIVPLTILGGLYDVFTSSVWTLTYRELLALENILPQPSSPALDLDQPNSETVV